MSKTIEQWLNELPEPQRTSALEQCDKFQAQKVVPELRDALFGFAKWSTTKERAKYWLCFVTSIIEKEK